MAEEQKSLKQIAEEEQKRFEEETEKYRKEKGYKDFLVLSRGETKVEILDIPPRDWEQNGQIKKIFRAKVNEKEFDWVVNTRNPVYREVINSLAKGENLFFINRSGTGTDTRYEFISLQEKAGKM